MELAGVGVWSSQLRYGDAAESADAAAELDELGFSALWIPDVGGQVFDAVGRLLTATRRTTVATGILNLWMHSPGDVAESYAALTAEHGDRFLLGIGVSHAPLIDAGHIAAAFHRAMPLQEAEIDLLYDLILMRLVTSVTMSASRRDRAADNAYLAISEAPAGTASCCAGQARGGARDWRAAKADRTCRSAAAWAPPVRWR